MLTSKVSESLIKTRVGRIAPTPSGYLHMGNAFNFLLTWLLVKRQSGRLILRIDDLDAPRIKPEYVEDVFRVLEWIGLDWDAGPSGPDELKHFSQHTRLPLYETFLKQLWQQQAVFVCTCSRSQLKETIQYPGNCLGKHLIETAGAWRLITADEYIVIQDWLENKPLSVSLFDEMRYPVVRKRDGSPAYQIASLADDVHMGVNVIVRGLDLLPSTAIQLYMARILGQDEFEQVRFYHHDLIKTPAGEKLSKSAGATSIRAYRQHNTPDVFYREFAQWLHLPHADEIATLQELLTVFPAI